MNVEAVHEAVAEVKPNVRRGDGPTLAGDENLSLQRAPMSDPQNIEPRKRLLLPNNVIL
jgi:hypothetical protein